MIIIYKQVELDKIFDDESPFNMDKRVKQFKKDHIIIDKILEDLEARLLSGKGLNVYQQVRCSKGLKCRLIKIRLSNFSSNKGTSSGIRAILIYDECNDFVFLFELYSKQGSNRKDDISKADERTLKEIFNKYVGVMEYE